MKRNKFSLSHYHLLSLNQGLLVPIGHYEVLPGDTVQHSTTALVRAAPLAAPVMHPVHCRIHHWFVPYRLLWDSFESFITGGPTGTDASLRPFFNINGSYGASTLLNYLGLPIGSFTNLQISALPVRAYQLIWNEWYRDQDLSVAAGFTKASGLDAGTSTTLQRVAWEKDYLTSARPWTQKGTAAGIPLSAAPSNPAAPGYFRNSTTNAIVTGAVTSEAVTGDLQVGGVDAYYNPNNTLTMDVNALRNATSVQRYMEARARFGSRYSEYLRYLGVKSSDARLQRPEYLGGGKQTIQFSEVLQTAEGTNPVGMMRGHGIGAMRSNRWRRFFEEHGIVMSLMSIKPRTVYMQGMHRSWFRMSKEDFWQKELEHIGSQPVYLREVYAPGASPGTLFGWQDRYDEYRHLESRVSGEFADTLKYWHMARDFASPPTLNGSFVEADPTNRVYQAPSASQMYVMAQHSIQARRMLSKVGSTGLF